MKRLTSREGYDLYAANYKKDHPHLDSFMDGAETEAWLASLDALLEEHGRVVALDAGCGDGRTLGRWVRRVEKRGQTDRVDFWGVDISPKMIEAARGRIQGPRWEVLDLASADAVAQWTSTHGRVHLLSAFFVLVHFDSQQRFFDNAAALLAPGGCLVMNTIPQPQAPELRASGKPVTIEAWDHSADDVVAEGTAAGLTLEHRQDFTQKDAAGRDELISTLLQWRKIAP